jgi:hypothetical protein
MTPIGGDMAAVKTRSKADTAPISADEVARRVAVLRRFRELLIKQRERFHSYIDILERQQTVIESGTVDELLAHVELEEQIVKDILSIQKVIDPLENLYNAGFSSPVDDVPALKITLESLKNQAITRSLRNRELLSTRMADLRIEISSLKNNPFTGTSRTLYEESGTAWLVDIEG